MRKFLERMYVKYFLSKEKYEHYVFLNKLDSFILSSYPYADKIYESLSINELSITILAWNCFGDTLKLSRVNQYTIHGRNFILLRDHSKCITIWIKHPQYLMNSYYRVKGNIIALANIVSGDICPICIPFDQHSEPCKSIINIIESALGITDLHTIQKLKALEYYSDSM